MENILYCMSLHIIAYYTLHKLLKNTYELILKRNQPKRKMGKIIIFNIQNRYLLIK